VKIKIKQQKRNTITIIEKIFKKYNEKNKEIKGKNCKVNSIDDY